jgi:hypothetical protein
LRARGSDRFPAFRFSMRTRIVARSARALLSKASARKCAKSFSAGQPTRLSHSKTSRSLCRESTSSPSTRGRIQDFQRWMIAHHHGLIVRNAWQLVRHDLCPPSKDSSYLRFEKRRRQSSPARVEYNRESTAPACFAREGQEFGWATEQVIVIDEERIPCGLRMQTNDPRRKGRETRASLAFRRLLP